MRDPCFGVGRLYGQAKARLVYTISSYLYPLTRCRNSIPESRVALRWPMTGDKIDTFLNPLLFPITDGFESMVARLKTE